MRFTGTDLPVLPLLGRSLKAYLNFKFNNLSRNQAEEQLAKARCLADRWGELSRKLEVILKYIFFQAAKSSISGGDRGAGAGRVRGVPVRRGRPCSRLRLWRRPPAQTGEIRGGFI